MKTLIIMLLVLASGTALAGQDSQLAISAKHYPGATVRITTHGCENGITRHNRDFIAPNFDIQLDAHGKAITRLLANDKELYCNQVGFQQIWSTWYSVQIIGSDHKEKIVKVYAGKTSKVKL